MPANLSRRLALKKEEEWNRTNERERETEGGRKKENGTNERVTMRWEKQGAISASIVIVGLSACVSL